MFPPDGW
jgi:hypothetical protein